MYQSAALPITTQIVALLLELKCVGRIQELVFVQSRELLPVYTMHLKKVPRAVRNVAAVCRIVVVVLGAGRNDAARGVAAVQPTRGGVDGSEKHRVATPNSPGGVLVDELKLVFDALASVSSVVPAG